MFLFKWIIKGMGRQKWKTLLMLSISFLMVLLLGMYIKTIEKIENEMDNIYDAAEIKMRIQDIGGNVLEVSQEDLKVFEESGYFKNTIYSAGFGYQYDFFLKTEERDNKSINVFTFNSPKGHFSKMQSFYGDQSKGLSYGECIVGDYSPIAKVTSDHPVILYPEPVYTWTFPEEDTVVEPIITIDEEKSIRLNLKAVKYVKGNNVYLNYDQFVEICNRLGIPVNIISAEYVIKDNRNIEKLHQFLGDMQFFKDNMQFNYQILDGNLKDTIEPLQLKIKIMKGLLPVLYLLFAVVGFTLSYITVRREKSTMFLMQSMGSSKIFRFLSVFITHMFYLFLSVVTGVLIMHAEYVLLYFLCYLTGSIIALTRMIIMKYYTLARA